MSLEIQGAWHARMAARRPLSCFAPHREERRGTAVVVVVYCITGITDGWAAPKPTSATTTRHKAEAAATATAVRRIEPTLASPRGGRDP